MKTFQQNLRDYAELAIQVGIHQQKGLIRADVEALDLVRELTRAAYEAKLRRSL